MGKPRENPLYKNRNFNFQFSIILSYPESVRSTPEMRRMGSAPSNRPYGELAPSSKMMANPMRSSHVDLNSLVCSSISEQLRHRRKNLEAATAHWPNVEAVVETAISLGDQSTMIDLLNVINRRASSWSLAVCAKLLTQSEQCSINQMLITKETTTLETLLDTLNLIARNFSQIIYDNITSSENARDLQSEDRKERAEICYNSLRQAKSVLQSRSQSEGNHLNGRIRTVLIALSDY
jgi:hypothetical protein